MTTFFIFIIDNHPSGDYFFLNRIKMFVIKFFYSIKRYFYRKFYSKPSRALLWTVQDFEIGKNWAKSQPHPHFDKYDLWDYLKNRDSVEILHYLNTKLKETNTIL